MFDTFIVQPIFNLLMILSNVIPGRNLAIGIVIFTVIVRFLMYPLLKGQLHQTKAMRKMQPELARIKKKYGDNKQLAGIAMLELYKKYNINPFKSILILIIQLPIFIALFQVIRMFVYGNIQEHFEKYTYGLIKGIPAISEAVKDPNIISRDLFGFFDITKTAFASNTSVSTTIVLIALAIISGVLQYVMLKQTSSTAQSDDKKRTIKEILKEAADGKDADQAEINAIMMNNMNKIMPFMMVVIMISLPGAICLYYTFSNLIAVAQQKYILGQDEDELENIAESSYKGSKGGKNNREKKAKKAEIIKEPNVIRISAKDDRKKRR